MRRKSVRVVYHLLLIVLAVVGLALPSLADGETGYSMDKELLDCTNQLATNIEKALDEFEKAYREVKSREEAEALFNSTKERLIAIKKYADEMLPARGADLKSTVDDLIEFATTQAEWARSAELSDLAGKFDEVIRRGEESKKTIDLNLAELKNISKSIDEICKYLDGGRRYITTVYRMKYAELAVAQFEATVQYMKSAVGEIHGRVQGIAKAYDGIPGRDAAVGESG